MLIVGYQVPVKLYIKTPYVIDGIKLAGTSRSFVQWLSKCFFSLWRYRFKLILLFFFPLWVMFECSFSPPGIPMTVDSIEGRCSNLELWFYWLNKMLSNSRFWYDQPLISTMACLSMLASWFRRSCWRPHASFTSLWKKSTRSFSQSDKVFLHELVVSFVSRLESRYYPSLPPKYSMIVRIPVGLAELWRGCCYSHAPRVVMLVVAARWHSAAFGSMKTPRRVRCAAA